MTYGYLAFRGRGAHFCRRGEAGVDQIDVGLSVGFMVDERCLAMVAAGLGITTAPASLAVAGTAALAVEGYDFRRTIGLLHDPAWGEDEAALVDRVRHALAAMP